MRKLVTLILVGCLPVWAMGQINGPSPVLVNTNHTYSFDGLGINASVMWAVTGGTMNSFWQSGTEFYVDITWTSAGINQIQVAEDFLILATRYITVNNAIPDPPTATSATAIASTSFTANWNAVSGASAYQIDVSVNSAFSSFVYNNSNTTSTNFNVSGLTPATTYYYRVRASNASGGSASSNVISTVTLPAAPVALGASNLTTTSFMAN